MSKASLVPANAKRQPKPSGKLTDTTNSGELQLASHQHARDRAISEAEAKSTEKSTGKSFPTSTTTDTSNPLPSSTAASGSSVFKATSRKRKTQVLDSEDEEGQTPADSSKKTRLNPGAVSPNIASSQPDTLTLTDDESDKSEPEEAPRVAMKDKSRDVDAFFEAPIRSPDGKGTKRTCILCKRKRITKAIVAEVTTMRRHIEALHAPAYEKWCEQNSFKSKLPKAVKARKEAEQSTRNASQTKIDGHLEERPPKEMFVAYSDELFREAAIEWLVATDQPIQALEHPSFHKMIGVAARATNGVVIPNRKATRRHIMDVFKSNLTALRKRLTSDKAGLVSLTCDSWQASNQDAFFACTGHWNEEVAPGIYEEHHALLGFTPMNTAHDGVRLGRALFKIVKRLGFAHKVGWVTCDNAANNMTMLRHFELKLNTSPLRNGRKRWDHRVFHIRCLAHVINLATQALISTYSKTKHFNPAEPTDHDPDVNGFVRDVVGLVRAITVKARSSAKRKQRLLNLQLKAGQKSALTLLLDMKVRWSSTYNMLRRALELRPFIKDFVYETGREETDNEKRAKIDKLLLTESEWQLVKMIVELLGFADSAQQAFSYDSTPTLHAGIPALEALHKAWSSRASRSKYGDFSDALTAAAEKINEYYVKTATSHAYTFAMLLDPTRKMGYFEKHWPKDLQTKVSDAAEEIFKERYLELNVGNPVPKAAAQTSSKKLSKLFAELSDSDDDDKPATAAASATPSTDAQKPWIKEFRQYLNGIDEVVPEGMSLIQWWGIHSSRLPVWASLARDYLAIMASSVSSERAFSSAGITITKRRNRLKGDVIEALQFLKCLLRGELIFREPFPSSILEAEYEDVVEDDGDPEWVDEDPKSWDDLIINAEAGTDDEVVV